jgi:Domain of unknown function (DUF1707)
VETAGRGGSPEEVWSRFAHDPRDPATAVLRAADADREIIHRVLGDAFADGRLDREEYDERSSAVWEARTLGDLPPLVADLVPERTPVVHPKAGLLFASAADLQRMAVQRWEEARRHALVGFVGSTLVCWAIWAATSLDDGDFNPYFPWPLIVMAVSLANLVKTMVSRREIVASEVQRLERKQAKLLKYQRPPDRPHGP